MNNLIEKAISIGNAIGMPLTQNEAKSHDPFFGYLPGEITDLIGEQAVKEIRGDFEKEAIKDLGKEINLNKPVVAKRGKLKGVKGWVSKSMPSQYDENKQAHLVVSIDGTSGWVNENSLKVRVPDIGEKDEVDQAKILGEEVRKLARGTCVKHIKDGRVGYLLGKGSDDQSIPQVAIQWTDMPQEEYVLAHHVKENKGEGA
jgi:hypothetical protein